MEWTKVLGRFAIPVILLVVVKVHVVPISFTIQGLKAKQTMEDIIKQNYTIERLAQKRLRRIWIGEKVKLSLIIGIQSEKITNVLFNQGLFLKGDHYLVTKYKTTFLITQCLKYQGFNYITKSYKREAKCGRCTGQYNTSNCIEDPLKKCINYKAGHKAQSGACSVKRTQQEKAIAIRAYILTYHASAHKTSMSGQ